MPAPAVTATFDSLVTNPGRLKILIALATGERLEFVQLRRSTGLTDGNLCSHTRRLETAGLVMVEKSFRDRKPVTHMVLTSSGRTALEQHAQELLAALGMSASDRFHPTPRREPATEQVSTNPQPIQADDWVD